MTGTTARRHATRIVAAIVIAATIAGPIAAVPAGASPLRVHAAPTTPDRLRVGQDAWQLLKLTNTARERRGLATLQLDREASRIARHEPATK